MRPILGTGTRCKHWAATKPHSKPLTARWVWRPPLLLVRAAYRVRNRALRRGDHHGMPRHCIFHARAEPPGSWETTEVEDDASASASGDENDEGDEDIDANFPNNDVGLARSVSLEVGYGSLQYRPHDGDRVCLQLTTTRLSLLPHHVRCQTVGQKCGGGPAGTDGARERGGGALRGAHPGPKTGRAAAVSGECPPPPSPPPARLTVLAMPPLFVPVVAIDTSLPCGPFAVFLMANNTPSSCPTLAIAG